MIRKCVNQHETFKTWIYIRFRSEVERKLEQKSVEDDIYYFKKVSAYPFCLAVGLVQSDIYYSNLWLYCVIGVWLQNYPTKIKSTQC